MQSCSAAFGSNRTGTFCWKEASPFLSATRALEILIALLERPWEVVSKDELVGRAWPNTFVEESNLRAQVAVLRKALDNSQTGMRYIAAVPGRGYRFVAEISA